MIAAAIQDKISSSSASTSLKKAQSFFTRGSAGSDPVNTKIKTVLKGLDVIDTTLGDTLKALKALKKTTGDSAPELEKLLSQASSISGKILTPGKQVSKSESDRLLSLLNDVDTFLQENKKIRVGDTTLREFLKAFEKENRVKTVATKNIGDQISSNTKALGTSFGSFLGDNIEKISQEGLAKDATKLGLSLLGGPFAPLLVAATDIIDVKKTLDVTKNAFSKATNFAGGLISKIKDKKKASELVAETNTSTIATKDTEAQISAVKDTTAVDSDILNELSGYHSQTLSNREDEKKSRDRFNEDVLDGLDDIVKAIQKIDVGGGGLLDSLPGGRRGSASVGKLGKASKLGKLLSRLGKLGKFAKIGGGVLAAGLAGIDKFNQVKNDSTLNTEQKTAQVATTAIGAGGGAAIGAALGTALIPIPVLGTLIGASIGGWLGGKGGDKLGKEISDKLDDTVNSGKVKSGIQDNIKVPQEGGTTTITNSVSPIQTPAPPQAPVPAPQNRTPSPQGSVPDQSKSSIEDVPMINDDLGLQLVASGAL